MNELYVFENKIYDNNNEIILKGVSKSGLEYLYVDYNLYLKEFIKKDIITMKNWGFNCVRLPLRNSHWMDLKYQKLLDLFINYLNYYNFYIILDLHTLNNHSELDLFMIKDDKEYNALNFWKMISNKYKNNYKIMYEIYNEPHNISPETWWFGDEYYFGYKEIILAIRQITNQIIILGGLDYAYQLNFLLYYPIIFHDIKQYSNIVFNSHPYSYKGFPAFDHLNTIKFNINHFESNDSLSCPIGYSLPNKKENFTQGWIDSFAYLHFNKSFPLIITEFGLDSYENSLQGGWYMNELLKFFFINNISFIAWAWVPDRLDYPSLITSDLEPTGIASIGDGLQSCSVYENNYYPGPGKLVKQYLNSNESNSIVRNLLFYKNKLSNDSIHFNYIIIPVGIIILIKLLKYLKYTFKFIKKFTYKKMIKHSSLQNILVHIKSSKSLRDLN
jgi:aryl-phospho-beta-D-glucosidase BglC (GH1 family)